MFLYRKFGITYFKNVFLIFLPCFFILLVITYPENERIKKGRKSLDDYLQSFQDKEISNSLSYDMNRRKLFEINNNASRFNVNPILGRFDNTIKFKIFDKVFTGSSYASMSTNSALCYATQSSVDHLHMIIELSKSWEDSPISVAVFVPDVEYEIAIVYMEYLMNCFPHLFNKLSIHLVFPTDHFPSVFNEKIDIPVTKTICNNPHSILKMLLSKRSETMLKWRTTMLYPQNVLRNIARKNCGTKWVFQADIDIIPNLGFTKGVSEFLQSKVSKACERCVYVIPTYEVKLGEKFPENRQQLLGLKSQGLARPFHDAIYKRNQHASNLKKWETKEKFDSSESRVTVSHNVTKFELYYEPFYISKDNVPAHEERFLGYGLTRNTQVYETFLAGYTFAVLSPVFTVHWGLQEKSDRPAWRQKQNVHNEKVFHELAYELYAKYQKDPFNLIKNKKKKELKVIAT